MEEKLHSASNIKEYINVQYFHTAMILAAEQSRLNLCLLQIAHDVFSQLIMTDNNLTLSNFQGLYKEHVKKKNIKTFEIYICRYISYINS